MWWTFDEFNENNIYKGSFSAHGSGGQFITIIPKLDWSLHIKLIFKKNKWKKNTKTHLLSNSRFYS